MAGLRIRARKAVLRWLVAQLGPDWGELVDVWRAETAAELKRDLAEAHRDRHKPTPEEAFQESEAIAAMLKAEEGRRQTVRAQIRRVI